MFNPEFEEKSQKKNLIILVLGGLLVIVCFALGYFFYIQTTPEKVLEKMESALKKVKTYEFDGEMKAKITIPKFSLDEKAPATKTGFTLSANFQGKADLQDEENPKTAFSLEITFIPTTPNEFIQDSLTLRIEEMRMINEITYLKLGNLPKLEFIDLSFLSNQWIKIDPKSLEEKLGVEKSKLPPEEIKKIEKIIKEAKVLKITKKLPDEKIGGIATYHYKFLIDKEALKKLMIEVESSLQHQKLTEKEIAHIEKGFEGVEVIEGEIWIGKKSYLPYKITLLIKIKETKENQMEGEFNMTIFLKNYNKPVEIQVPSPVKSIEEVMEEILQQFLKNMEQLEFRHEIKVPKLQEK